MGRRKPTGCSVSPIRTKHGRPTIIFPSASTSYASPPPPSTVNTKHSIHFWLSRSLHLHCSFPPLLPSFVAASLLSLHVSATCPLPSHLISIPLAIFFAVWISLFISIWARVGFTGGMCSPVENTSIDLRPLFGEQVNKGMIDWLRT